MLALAERINQGEFQHQIIADDRPLALECGEVLENVSIAYETYGRMNADSSNIILVCHALTGDQFVAGKHPITGKAGWWSSFVGAGQVIDTDQYFVICANILGGCMGSTGPMSINPETKEPYALSFPMLTISDMVHAQKRLMDKLGIEKLFAVVGGSMGGAQALEWAVHYPDFVERAVVMAIGARYSAQNIGFNEVSRQAILADPHWQGGAYQASNISPTAGLSLARMSKHITYMSEQALQGKFGRNLQDRDVVSFNFDADFQIESYLRHQGESFVDRFDANSYLYLSRSFDYYDLEIEHGQKLAEIFAGSPVKFCLLSYSTDWFCPPEDTREIAQALNAAGVRVSYAEIEYDRGHDSFLMNVPKRDDIVRNFFAMDADDGHQSDDTPAHARDIRADFHVIRSLIDANSSVLDVGCGDGTLLAYLRRALDIQGCGLELSEDGVRQSVSRGLNVIQGDAQKDLSIYLDQSYDYAILSHTIQAMSNPRNILEELLRVGKKAIIALPNFGHWSVRWSLLLKGRMPVTKAMPYRWYNTPNIHFCTLVDFEILCEGMGIQIERKVILNAAGHKCGKTSLLPHNLFGLQAVYLISKV